MSLLGVSCVQERRLAAGYCSLTAHGARFVSIVFYFTVVYACVSLCVSRMCVCGKVCICVCVRVRAGVGEGGGDQGLPGKTLEGSFSALST